MIRVESAKGKETGAAMLIVRDDFGIEIPIRFGTMEERREWMDNPKLVLGKKFTFKYSRRSPDNVPIEPGGVAFRDYE